MHVPLHDHMLNNTLVSCVDSFLSGERLRVARQKNALTLAGGLWLDDEGSIALTVDLG